MNPTERKVARDLREDGYTVLRSGWPDLLAYKEQDVHAELVFVEVKLENEKGQSRGGLHPNQDEMRKILSKFFKFEVRYEKHREWNASDLVEMDRDHARVKVEAENRREYIRKKRRLARNQEPPNPFSEDF